MFLILGYLCNAQSDETESLPTMTGTFGNTITGIPLTTPTARDGDNYGLHKSDHVPGLCFKLLLPSNPESVLPHSSVQVCASESCEYTVPLLRCCFPPNDCP